MAIGGNNITLINKVKTYIGSCFKIKDLGPLKYFLGLEVSHTKAGLYICQRKYAYDILKDTGLQTSKQHNSPIDMNIKLSITQRTPLEDPLQFRRLIGRLMYLTLTRPDISYAVNTLNQFIQHPTDIHMTAATRIVKYIKGNLAQGLFYPTTNPLQVKAYCDSDWASCSNTRRLVTGYMVKIGEAFISWRSNKQKTVSKSSAEAEYRAMASTTSEYAWINSLFKELQIQISHRMDLFCDNQAAMHIATNHVFHERTKHIEIDLYYTREKVEEGMIKLKYLKSAEQPADLLTKALSVARLQHLLSKLNMILYHV
ncbi:uncharacterized mitochondrial protein AtMg00810-like [Tripterygium wilfordii]|uniref:uncharacterized mitochondrial protein AtMg00810-like n=1 Tax=Tripterygium wilfordii TaxID=458696 RepID=UPI0018F86426|nr:uncharacterized mitochondrial protein AtMg00810-like [Tripterygium wilfordii]